MSSEDGIQAEALAERVAAARSLAHTWEHEPIAARVERLRPLFAELRNRRDEIADLICEENGKPRVEAVGHEITTCLANLDFLLRRAPEVLGPRKQGLKWMPNRQAMIIRRAHGVVLVISPWNVPLAIPLAAVLSSVLAGNAVILKPSEVTPRIGGLIGDLLRCCHLPPGLVQVIQGDGKVGAGLIAARPDKVFFTGSVATGRRVMAAAAQHPIPVSLELGGVDAMIVCEDADLELAASAAAWGATFNGGQVCASVERLLVQESVVEHFSQLLADKLERIDPVEELGRITMPRQREVYDRHIADARERGLELVLGGDYLDEHHMAPTLVQGEGILDSKVYREETFGPVVTLAPFASESDAIRLHNDSPYGLTASIFTRSRSRARGMAARLRTGLVSVNDIGATLHGHAEVPWGGVGESGFGRSHGEEGLLEATWAQVIDESRWNGFEPKRPWWYPYDHRQMALIEAFTDLVGAECTRSRLRALGRAGKAAVGMATRSPRS
jgi:succinate-semialdehyde dehydrogenase/glutarate-semialdehyde dehydrogenase